MSSDPKFGLSVQIMGCAVTHAAIPKDHGTSIPMFVQMARDIAGAIGVTPSHPPQVTDYPPGEDGSPSPGFMVCQPIITSFVMLDVWPQLGLFYAHIVSCKEFDSGFAAEFFGKRGMVVEDSFDRTLSA